MAIFCNDLIFYGKLFDILHATRVQDLKSHEETDSRP